MVNQEALLIIVPLVIGLTQIIKSLLPDNMVKKFTPLISLVFGIGSSLLWYGISKESVLTGIIAGLSAGGLWSGAKNLLFKRT